MTRRRVLVELTVTEQRYRAVLEVEAGIPVIEVAERFGVSRQTVHLWLRCGSGESTTGQPDELTDLDLQIPAVIAGQQTGKPRS